GVVAGQGAVVDRQRPHVQDATATPSGVIGVVAGQGTVVDRQGPADSVGDAAAAAVEGAVGVVAAQGAVGKRQCPGVVDPATGGAIGVAVGDGQPGDGVGGAGGNLEDLRGVVAADRQLVGARAADGQVLAQEQRPVGGIERDGLTGQAPGEEDRVA